MTGSGRLPFAHEASLVLEPGADPAAPGAAVTVALCGHWEHPGACRWPHHTAVARDARPHLDVRVVFACDPVEEGDVRGRVVAALRAGGVPGNGDGSRWTVAGQGASPLAPDEQAMSQRLAGQ